MLPPLLRVGAGAERDHRRDPRGVQAGKNGVVVEPPVEEERSELPAGHPEVTERLLEGE